MKKKIISVLLIMLVMLATIGAFLFNDFNKVKIPELKSKDISASCENICDGNACDEKECNKEEINKDKTKKEETGEEEKSEVEQKALLKGENTNKGKREEDKVKDKTEKNIKVKDKSSSGKIIKTEGETLKGKDIKDNDKLVKEEKKIAPDKEVENTQNNKKDEQSKPSKELEDDECTITIRCDTAINTGVNKKEQFKHLPADGVILGVTTVKFKEGDTVYDILQKVVRENKIHMEYTGFKTTIYIEGIDNLYEFDGGRWSGWMYCVNGWYPNYGCGSYKVKGKDVIEWNYTCDLGEDLGQHWLGEDIRKKEK